MKVGDLVKRKKSAGPPFFTGIVVNSWANFLPAGKILVEILTDGGELARSHADDCEVINESR